MILAVVNQKGGVGKTTLAVHLAAWHLDRGRRVAFIDADGQSSSSRWIRGARWNVTLHAETAADSILELAAALEPAHDVVIADGPASLAESTRALLLIADYVLIPCGVTVPELESTAETVRMLVNARRVRGGSKPPAHLVLTRVRSDRFLLTRDALQAIHSLGLPVCETVLRLREATADAAGQRTAVWKMGPRGKRAADETLELLQEIDAHARTTIDDGNAQLTAIAVPPRRRIAAAIGGRS